MATAAEQREDASTSVFVKNLNFDTSDEALRDKFDAAAPHVLSATVSRHRDKARLGRSMGFGFVTYATHDQARNALRKLQVIMNIFPFTC